MRKLLIVLVALLFVGCKSSTSTGDYRENVDDDYNVVEEVFLDQVVEFRDPILEGFIRSELGVSGDITVGDMKDLYFLTIEDLGVVDLTGLEYAVNLLEFTIAREEVESLDPISYLSDLERLTIRYVEIDNLPVVFDESVNLNFISATGTILEDVSFVSHMTNLNHVTMSDAGIEDVSAFENLINLERINLQGNSVEDISFFSKLEVLSSLNLQGNNVSDIEVLAGLNNLEDVTLSYNPVYVLSPLFEIDSLESVRVYLNHEVKHHIFDDVEVLLHNGIDVSYHR